MVSRYVVPLLVAAGAGCTRPALESARPGGPAGDASAAAMRMPANADGRAVFDAVCATCHTVDPPASLAPPMGHVARHYRAESGDDERRGVARIAQWVRTPARERSLLPAHAIERWGVMPALALSGAQLDAVARYVWSLGEEASVGMREGRGMMMRGGHGGMGEGRGPRGSNP